MQSHARRDLINYYFFFSNSVEVYLFFVSQVPALVYVFYISAYQSNGCTYGLTVTQGRFLSIIYFIASVTFQGEEEKYSTNIRYKCTWKGCKVVENTCNAIEKHIRLAHLGYV